MKTFELHRASGVAEATAKTTPGSRYIAGGTTLIDLMRLDVERPAQLIDINHLPLANVTALPDGGLRIGALARNSDVANNALVKTRYPVLSQALLSGASAQLRNAASTGGNVLQKTRCVYFRDANSPCNKREPGTGCPAIAGYNRNLAILGTSDHCIASSPSDQNVAFTVLDATLDLQTANAKRSVPFRDFYVLPGNRPERETVLAPGELIVAVNLPAPAPGTKSGYLKLRDRASYEFALASTAVSLTLDKGVLQNVRVALGGVGTRPWPAREAEALLEGAAPSPDLFARAASAALQSARPQTGNAFKIELAKRSIATALATVVSGETHA